MSTRFTSKSLRLLCLTNLLGVSIAYAGPADQFADVEVTSQHVSGSVHMLVGAGGNIGVSVGTDGTLIIDDQFAPLAPKIEGALVALGGDRPRLVLNTHFHGDHTGSNPYFGASGTIISHDNVRVRLLNEEKFPRTGLPLVTYGERINVHFNNDTIELIHLPSGHTDGDSVVWFKSANVIHMGDHFFNGRYPYVDIGSGGSIDGLITNVEAVIKMVPQDIRIIPGHGALANLDDLKTTIKTVKDATALVRKQLKRKADSTDIIAALDKAYPEYGSGFINAERWIQIVQADAANK